MTTSLLPPQLWLSKSRRPHNSRLQTDPPQLAQNPKLLSAVVSVRRPVARRITVSVSGEERPAAANASAWHAETGKDCFFLAVTEK